MVVFASAERTRSKLISSPQVVAIPSQANVLTQWRSTRNKKKSIRFEFKTIYYTYGFKTHLCRTAAVGVYCFMDYISFLLISFVEIKSIAVRNFGCCRSFIRPRIILDVISFSGLLCKKAICNLIALQPHIPYIITEIFIGKYDIWYFFNHIQCLFHVLCMVTKWQFLLIKLKCITM